MGSLSRTLARHLMWKRPKQAVPVSEGVLLSKRLERAAKEAQDHARKNGRDVIVDPLDYLEYLRRMRRGYDPRTDGASPLMELVDAIGKFEVEELARRKATAESERG